MGRFFHGHYHFVKSVGSAFVRILPFSPSFVQKLITNHYHYKSPSSKMWAGRQKCGQTCPHFWRSGQIGTPPGKNTCFRGVKKSELPKLFTCGTVTCIISIFLKKIGKNRSALPSALAKRIFRRLYGVATTNKINIKNSQWSQPGLSVLYRDISRKQYIP